MTGSTVDVAAAVIERADGSFMLARRPEGKAYAGYWEFPGGKVEAGERVSDALARELREELGIDVEVAYPWITRNYSYPHANVRLHFHRVVRWRGEPVAHEGQSLAWQKRGTTTVSPMLPANAPILKALTLPDVYAITHAWETGIERGLAELDTALERGVRMVQIRERALKAAIRQSFAQEVVRRVHAVNGIVLVNADILLASAIGADGVHLPANNLMTMAGRPDFRWCGMSCHDSDQLARAATLDADFVVLGPVGPTPSHRGKTGMGWQRFAGLINSYSLPVFALGGMHTADLPQAWRCGAHGVAMIRGAWDDEPPRFQVSSEPSSGPESTSS
jgi:8-oxo-dGTP diphosphatase